MTVSTEKRVSGGQKPSSVACISWKKAFLVGDSQGIQVITWRWKEGRNHIYEEYQEVHCYHQRSLGYFLHAREGPLNRLLRKIDTRAFNFPTRLFCARQLDIE